jgi:ribosomal protein L3 glutamine methyltransferase
MKLKPRVAKADEAERSLSSIGDFTRWAVSRFGEAGIAYGQSSVDALDEALALIRWSLHLPPEDALRWFDAQLAPSERKALVAAVEARCRLRVPSAYITGEAWLRGLRFHSDARALVPRSLIAEAIDTALPDWLDGALLEMGWPRRILDLCTGGGSLAVLAADRFPNATVVASDIDTQALELARDNVALYQLSDRIELRHGDLLDSVAGERFDLIVCNPPYVNHRSMERLPPEYQAEPRHALDGGDDGMDLIRHLLAKVHQHLNPGGILLLEIGHEAPHFEAAFPRLEFAYLPVTVGEQMVVLARAEHLFEMAKTQPSAHPRARAGVKRQTKRSSAR